MMNWRFLAKHCTEEEDAAKKVERQVGKSAAALLLESRIGEQFDAIVTGASPKGTWVRLLNMPVEGRLVHGFEGIDVGDRIRVRADICRRRAGIYRFQESWSIKTLKSPKTTPNLPQHSDNLPIGNGAHFSEQLLESARKDNDTVLKELESR